MRKGKSATLVAALLASVSTLSTAGCATAQVEARTAVPALSFPAFPDPDGWVSLDAEKETVTMPLEYYARIYEYKVRVDETRAVYERMRELHAERSVSAKP